MTGKRNVTLWAMIGIPTAAVLASLYTMYLAYSGAEPKLPSRYVSEGAALDADFARAAAAAAAGIVVKIEFADDGRIEAQLEASPATDLPDELRLELTHTTLPKEDRSITLQRSSESLYTATTSPLPAGRWLGELSSNEWRLRARLDTTAAPNMVFGR